MTTNPTRSGFGLLMFLILLQAFVAPWIDGICRSAAKHKREHVAQPFTASFRP